MGLASDFARMARGEAMSDLDQEIRDLEVKKALIEQEIESLYRLKEAQDHRDTQEDALDRAVQ